MEASNTDSETLSTFNEEQWCDDSDVWSENETESPAGVTDTILTSIDFVEDNERQYIINLAPAEGSRPLSLFWGQILRRNSIPTNIFGTGTTRN